ncbi:5550_t:CDS:2 [Ambispora gerdemannii]|uniref:5550_t:CDS:1 n=1 Tax=Ambispora gerdemannii TaxID=144530 RepID=A0A9N8V7E3_9GLOM|nr:5550_t:CDS:2 [Ambispora gerdemannii]
MSANRPSRHHNSIKYASADHDRDKKLAYSSHGSKKLKIFKWVKSDRKIKFDDDEEGEEESLRQMVSEDISTPTASIIQPLTAASTPQPSEPEPDSTPKPIHTYQQTTQNQRPTSLIATAVKHATLIRESSSTMSTPPADIFVVNTDNNTPQHETGGVSGLDTPDRDIEETEDEELEAEEIGGLSDTGNIRRSSQELMRFNIKDKMQTNHEYSTTAVPTNNNFSEQPVVEYTSEFDDGHEMSYDDMQQAAAYRQQIGEILAQEELEDGEIEEAEYNDLQEL